MRIVIGIDAGDYLVISSIAAARREANPDPIGRVDNRGLRCSVENDQKIDLIRRRPGLKPLS